LAVGCTSYEGEGILNVVEVGERYKVDDIKEIIDFTALYIEGSKRDLDYILTLRGDVQLEHPDGGLLPTLILMKEGQVFASVHLRVSRDEKQMRLILEWSAVPDFHDDSYCFLQLYPNSEEMFTLKIPFSAAKVSKATKERGIESTTIDRVRDALEKQRSDDESD
jgi:hypothetical protein